MGCTLIDQVWDDLCHAFVALGKGLGIVIIALFAVLKHILQMGDQLKCNYLAGLLHQGQ